MDICLYPCTLLTNFKMKFSQIKVLLNIVFVNIYLDCTVLIQLLTKDILSFMRTGYNNYLHNYYN